MLILLVPSVLYVVGVVLGMSVQEEFPWEIALLLVFSVFQSLMLSLPLFKQIRENRKYKLLFVINLLILLFNTYEVINYAVTSDFVTMKGIIYIVLLFIISDLFLGNFKLVKNKF